MNAKHTPGKWEYTPAGKQSQCYTIIATDNMHLGGIAHVYAKGKAIESEEGGFDFSMPDMSEANARLIAAAPELLEALQNALNVMAGISVGHLSTIKPDSHAISLARAAIAKAKVK